jgi:hypothetical protein
MDLNNYLNISKYSNGEIISKLVVDLDKLNNFNNILFIRTPTTGEWLDKILTNNSRVTRILYTPNVIFNHKYRYDKNTIIINSDDLQNTFIYLDKKFDLIVIDPFHEYDYSKRDFELCYLYLSEIGMLLSHDCFPPSINHSNKKYIFAVPWSGETYIAFVEFAYNNPKLYYGLLNIDTGIGIISKKNMEYLSNNLNRQKQEELLKLYNNNNDNIYYFFVKMLMY